MNASLLVTMSISLAGIDYSLEALTERYGKSEEYTYRPDLYPTSYIFEKDGITITVTLFANRAKKLDVFFEELQVTSIENLLETYSGRSAWQALPTSDPAFAKHFPLFSTEGRNSLYACDGVVALVQRDVGLGKLALWIQTSDYPNLLAQYRVATEFKKGLDS